MIKNKKGSAWIWILTILIIIVLGLGVYFFLSGNESSIISSINSVPQPPKLPSV